MDDELHPLDRKALERDMYRSMLEQIDEEDAGEYVGPVDEYGQPLKDKTCRQCHGTGQSWDGILPCDNCDGEGYEWWQ
jgi:hypothetical protein